MKFNKEIAMKWLNKLSLEQWKKIMQVIIVCISFLLIIEIIFRIPAVSQFFSTDLIKGESSWAVYLVVWLLMFAQVSFIPIPALPILVACNQIPGLIAADMSIGALFSAQTLFFMLIITSATVVGAAVSYGLGRAFGQKAIKWVAGSEEDYAKWSNVFNSKWGKWAYTGTVLLPIFPDDLLSVMMGAMKLNFPFYIIVNMVCRFIGLFTMIFFMRLLDLIGIPIFSSVGEGFPFAILVYSLILIGALIILSVLSTKIKSKSN